ncbi:nucleic acid-binding protein [Elizabethkingia phage TCUEAP1]|nr:nucleic acid-binding protein [Elizabethkingia phage TCUEAP1]
MAKVVTKGLVRFSYPNLFEPKAQAATPDKPQYSVTLLIPKTDTETLNAIKLAMAESIKDKWGDKKPASIKNPLRDGDLEKPDSEGYAGHYFINCKSPANRRPQVVGKGNIPIIDPDELHAGDYGLAAFTTFAYGDPSKGIPNGVSAGIDSIKLIKKGEKLGGSTANAADDFGSAFEDEATDTSGGFDIGL